MARVINIADTKNTVREPAGIWKLPNDLSMVVACSTEKVIICAKMVQKVMVVAHIGRSLATIFTSSTLVTEQSFQGFGVELVSKSPSATIAALSKKLYITEPIKHEYEPNVLLILYIIIN